MKIILIMSLLITDGPNFAKSGSVATASFQTRKACELAGEAWKLIEDYNQRNVKATYLCTGDE